jgi:two-component system response regulator PilR (NtrC family)
MEPAAREIFDMTEKISPPARVLVVDDEGLIRWSLNERLSSAGYEVLEAGDAASTLSYFREGAPPIDLVVLDLKLPDADGVDLLKRIKRVCPDCRVILMTAFGTPDKLLDARNAGAYDVVPKPFNLDKMLQTVERALA